MQIEAAADQVGDSALPDVVVVDAGDENDAAVLRAADVVVIHGRFSHARAGLARHLGVATTDLAQLTVRGSMRRAAWHLAETRR